MSSYQFVSFFHVGTLKTTNYWRSQIHLLDNIDQALRDGITPDDPTEDVYEDSRDFGIACDQLESGLDGFRSSTTADVEEVGRRAAVELDDVHGGHGEASTID